MTNDFFFGKNNDQEDNISLRKQSKTILNKQKVIVDVESDEDSINQQMKKYDPSTSIDSFTHKLAERNASKKE